MGKTLFFNIPATGHINPSLAVVAELVRRGEQVLYVNTAETRAAIEPTGAQFVAYPESSALATQMERTAGGTIPRNALALHRINEALLPWALDLIDHVHPDRVVFDSLAGWGKHAAHLRGMKAIASISTFVLDPRINRPPMPTGMILRTTAQVMGTLIPYLQTARRMRARHGKVSLGGPLGSVMNTGDVNLVYTSAAFQPGAERMGPRFHFVGPSISARPDTTGFPFEQITGSPVVYISLGTINNQNLEFYRACFAAFADHPGQFILSAGKRTDLAALNPIPANFIVRNFVPQLDVLQRSTVFITHGGMNSVHEGLWYNVPLIAIPQQIEQAVVAGQVEATGVGLALGIQPPLGQVRAEELRAALDRILGKLEGYRHAAARMGDTLRGAGGYVRAADVILGQ
jgi:hypothetical protein